MKKTTIAILGIAFATAIAIPAFALGLGNAPVQAQANPLSQRVCATLGCVNAAGDCPGNAGCYVDGNGDGICDNYTDGYGGGSGNGNGPCYTDDDGDGVCDNYAGGAGNGYGAGAGAGSGGAGRGHHGGGHHGAHC